MVVRRPEHASAIFHNLNYALGERIYRGLDRLPWEDLDNDYYAGELPDHLQELRSQLELRNADFSGVRLLQGYSETEEIWQRYRDTCEIIAVSSPELSAMKGSVEYDGPLRYLGTDCFILGEWSVVLRGIFARPKYFTREVTALNRFGLFDAVGDFSELVERYVQFAYDGLIEPLGDQPTVSVVKVFAAFDDRPDSGLRFSR